MLNAEKPPQGGCGSLQIWRTSMPNWRQSGSTIKMLLDSVDMAIVISLVLFGALLFSALR